MNIIKLTDKKILFLDGAMGTLLQKKGLKAGECPELWNIDKPENIIDVHLQYIKAGVDIINTNTFGANRIKLKEYKLEGRLEEINRAAVLAAKQARKISGKKVFISGSIGPTGEFLKPMGNLSFEEMFEVYSEQVKALAGAGADVINFETMVDLGELRAAVLAAKSVCSLPVFANLTFTESGRTLTGSDPLSAFNTLEGIGADFVGTNCGLGPNDIAKLIQGINRHIGAKIVIQANAGIPKLIDGKTVFTCSCHDYVNQLEAIVSEGVNIIGGCCGTTPEYIQEVIARFKARKPKQAYSEKPASLKISSPSKTALIERAAPFCRIGEKVNPSALKKVANDLKTGSIAGIKEAIRDQEQAGADILDINLGLGGSNEKASFSRIIPELVSFTQLPLCIDTTDSDALEEALRLYPGRALINSISGEAERMDRVLLLMKKYGSYAILLPLDEKGIPDNTPDRMKIIKKVLKEAKKYGLSEARFIVDALVMTVSAAPQMARLSLETVERAYREFGLLSTCGLSNVSFGLPGRNAVNASFLSMLIGYGMDAAILNPQDELMNTMIDSGNILAGRDPSAGRFVKKYQLVKNFFKAERNQAGEPVSNSSVIIEKKEATLEGKLYNTVVEGNKADVKGLLEEAVKKYKAQEILNQFMIPAITYVGSLYDKKVYFLPQLMLSAETMKEGLNFLEPYLKEETTDYKAKMIIATVKGDIHDIGKNIVSIMLENHGFKVYDLGKDVSKETILEKALEYKADIICLSALMTTTMSEMGKFSDYLKEKKQNIPLMIGGAVVNADYANQIGAFYSKDAVEAVEVAGKIMGSLKK